MHLHDGDDEKYNGAGQRAGDALAELRHPLDLEEQDSGPEDDLEAVEDHVGHVAFPLLELLDVRGEELVADDDDGFGTLVTKY